MRYARNRKAHKWRVSVYRFRKKSSGKTARVLVSQSKFCRFPFYLAAIRLRTRRDRPERLGLLLIKSAFKTRENVPNLFCRRVARGDCYRPAPRIESKSGRRLRSFFIGFPTRVPRVFIYNNASCYCHYNTLVIQFCNYSYIRVVYYIRAAPKPFEEEEEEKKIIIKFSQTFTRTRTSTGSLFAARFLFPRGCRPIIFGCSPDLSLALRAVRVDGRFTQFACISKRSPRSLHVPGCLYGPESE